MLKHLPVLRMWTFGKDERKDKRVWFYSALPDIPWTLEKAVSFVHQAS